MNSEQIQNILNEVYNKDIIYRSYDNIVNDINIQPNVLPRISTKPDPVFINRRMPASMPPIIGGPVGFRQPVKPPFIPISKHPTPAVPEKTMKFNVNRKDVTFELGDNNCFFNSTLSILLKNKFFMDDAKSSLLLPKPPGVFQYLFPILNNQNVAVNTYEFKKYLGYGRHEKQEMINGRLEKIIVNELNMQQDSVEFISRLIERLGHVQDLFTFQNKRTGNTQNVINTDYATLEKNPNAVFDIIKLTSKTRIITIGIDRLKMGSSFNINHGSPIIDILHIKNPVNVGSKQFSFSGGTVHNGTASGGHYFSVYKEDGKYYTFDNNNVTEISENDALNNYAYNLVFYSLII